MLLRLLWTLICQDLAYPRSGQDVAFAAQVLLASMLVGAVACPIALYFVCRNQRRREQRQRALAAEHGEVTPEERADGTPFSG
jgi:hypothetical protein